MFTLKKSCLQKLLYVEWIMGWKSVHTVVKEMPL